MKKALTTAALLALVATPALAEGDAAKGEKVFKKCKACHMVGDDAKVKAGPPLNNIMGATAGKPEGYEFKFSKAMMEAGEGGLVWDETTLDEFLAKPRDMVKGTKMSFAGLKKEEDRANIIAYLKTFSKAE